MAARADRTPSPAGASLTVTRVIDAPRELVFELWSKPEHLARWWGPRGFSLPACALEFKPGGAYRFGMRAPDGVIHGVQGTFREIVEPERIVFTFAWEEEGGRRGLETLVRVTFEEERGKTRLTLIQTGLGSEASASGHEDGWSQALERLAAEAASPGSAQ